MALKLINQLTHKFNPKTYHDSYTKELLEIIDEKVKGMKPRKKGKEPKQTHVHDIMEALKASLAQNHHHKKQRKSA